VVKNLIGALVLLLMAVPVKAQVRGWPPFYPHGTGVVYSLLEVDTASAALSVDDLMNALSRISYQTWEPDTIGKKIVKDANATWTISSSSSTLWTPPTLVVGNTTKAGANKSWQMFLDYTQNDMYFQVMDIWYFLRYRFGAAVTASTLAIADSAWCGIQIGTPSGSVEPCELNPPWDAARGSGYARLGIEPYSGKIILEVSKGNAIAEPLRVDVADRKVAPFLELDWNPYVPSLTALVNHVVVYAVTDTAYLPHFGSLDAIECSLGPAAGLFVETGASGISHIIATWICPYRMWFHPTTNGGGAPVWYQTE
jgi:hypothetical protein